MALNIKDETADRLLRQLAAELDTSLTQALIISVSERLAQEKRSRRIKEHKNLAEYISRGRARRVIDKRSADQILGYDENGFPK